MLTFALRPSARRFICPTVRAGRRSRVGEIIQEVTNQGAGILFISPNCEPWCCTFGHACHIRAYGALYDEDNPAHRPNLLKRNVLEGATIGVPSEQTLPPYAREHLRKFMKEKLGVPRPGVLLMYDPTMASHYNFMFNIQDGNAFDDQAIGAALDALGWFTPPMCGLLAASSKKCTVPFADL
jgi:hypothetical protein